ncbi:MAG TPA: esterase [Mycobacterium sp.]
MLKGEILHKFNESGGSNGPLGVPISDEQPGPDGGQYTKFQSGVIYWKPETGAHIVWGGIRTAWENHGGAGGPLGYPSSDERGMPGGWQQDFEHGTIAFTDGQSRVDIR